MALAEPVRMSMPTTKMNHLDIRSRQKQPFDANLLRSKLEAHKRELEQARLQKERRDAERERVFVPRTAAKQFAATATPMKDFQYTRDARPSTQPAMADYRKSLNPKQLFAALNSGMSESEAIAAIYHANEPWRKGTLESGAGRNASPSSRQPRSRSPRTDQIREAGRRRGLEEARAAGHYRPGDAEKRRIEEVKISFRDVAFDPKEAPHMAWHTAQMIPGHRQAREKEEDMPYDLRLNKEDEGKACTRSRPRLQQQSRPNWSQVSQSGDDMHRTLHLPRLHLKQKVENQADQEDDDSVLRSMSDCKGAPPAILQQRRASVNMISDAVKIIKKEEKVRRRESVLAFLKKVL